MKKQIKILALSLALLFTHPVEAAGAEIPLGGFSLWMQQNPPENWYTTEDLRLLANTIKWEVGDNTREAMLLCGSVVLNRLELGWADSIYGVLQQRGQYASKTKRHLWDEDTEDLYFNLAKHLLLTGSHAPIEVVYQGMERNGSRVYKKIQEEYFCYE